MKRIGLMLALILLFTGNSFAVDVVWDGIQYQCTPSGEPPPVTKYECAESNSGYHCFESSTGKYTTVAECQKACIPPPVEYPKLNKIAAGSGDWYGSSYMTILEGASNKYILPLSEVYPYGPRGTSTLPKPFRRLIVTSSAMMDGRGDIDIVLTSPEGWSAASRGAFADETINAIAQSYGVGVNYPAQYLPTGYWTLEIIGKQASEFKLWWKCY